MLYRRAAATDAALDEADRNAREQYVILSRNVERREHERLLPDTVLNTSSPATTRRTGPPSVSRNGVPSSSTPPECR
jgi:hypothetical protein